VNNVQHLGLFLEIVGIGENNEVYGDSLIIRGQTSPGAIVSINTVIVPVDETGWFEMELRLAWGPNSIDIVASDLDGNRESKSIAVVAINPEAT
jgi:hypothetical protein